ncbi:MAG: FAD-dependent monooxygenase [Myxococcota bacterium]
MSVIPELQVDVAIVGAGIAGATAAHVLGRAGRDVALIDTHAKCPSLFRAEKIEPDQVVLAGRLGVLDLLASVGTRIQGIHSARGGRIFRVEDRLQYGVDYPDIVNAVRDALPKRVQTILGRVTGLEPSETKPTVVLADGRRIAARLVVLAAGLKTKLAGLLGIGNAMISEGHSIAIGFDVKTLRDVPFPYPALTYYSSRPEEAYDCISLFPIGDRLRANLFVYRGLKDPWIRRLRDEPDAALMSLMPSLFDVCPRFTVTSRVEMVPIDLFRAERAPRAGMVLIADACQAVCPATGTGLSKVLNDVDVLTKDCIPRWLELPRLPPERIADFYASEQKRRIDEASLAAALYQKSLSTSTEMTWRVRRIRRYGLAGGSLGAFLSKSAL